MPFLVLGYDGNDNEAINRRLRARELHIKLGDELREQGKVLYGVAMLDDDKKMVGSVYIMNMDSKKELDNWLKIEPYVTGGVWKKIEIKECLVGPSFKNMKLVD